MFRMPALFMSLMPLLALGAAAGHAADAFVDPLDAPAPLTRLSTTTQLSAVAPAGDRLVAVGVRGLIILSEDGGKTWKQVEAPVSSDLTGVQFPTPADGWIVGQDGVVLHSSDGGTSWSKQLDGRQAEKLLTDHFNELAKAGFPNADQYLDNVKLNYQNGPEQALLGVWFKDASNGFVCGSFGTIFATHDGGKTWDSWMEHVDNPDLLHYYAITGVGGGGEVVIASERGTIFRLDPDGSHFSAVETGYGGTFFALAASGDAVLAAGLRGSAYRSGDLGATWTPVKTGLGGTFTGGAALHDGRVLLVSQDGRVIVGNSGLDTFSPVPLRRSMLFSGVTEGARGSLVLVGLAGTQQLDLP